MGKFIENILKPYKEYQNKEYLIKNFTSTKNLGVYKPYSSDAICSNPDGKSYVGTVDENNTYDINQFGFRGEIDQNAEILASGCSITFGVGVPELARWTNLLGNRINKSITNLGSPGASVESTCMNIIQYCLNVKMPKEIFCLFPDFFRSTVVIDNYFYETRAKANSSTTINFTDNYESISTGYCSPTILYNKGILSMEIKDKRYIEDSVSPHQLILKSINYIYMLESFCLTNNIKLNWTTWDLKTDLTMKELNKIENFKLKNFTSFYLDNPEIGANDYILQNCKSSHSSEFKNHLCWNSGSDYSVIDYKKIYNRAHPGIHTHWHIADFFYNLYN